MEGPSRTSKRMAVERGAVEEQRVANSDCRGGNARQTGDTMTVGRQPRRSSGEGSVYQRADGRWVATLHLGFGEGGKRKKRRAIAKTRSAAVTRLGALKADAGLGLDAASERWTIADWLQRWLDTEVKPTLRPRTHEQYAQVCRKHLIPSLGHLKLRALTPTDVRTYMQTKLEAKLSTRTVATTTSSCVVRWRLRFATATSKRMWPGWWAPRASRGTDPSRSRGTRCSGSWRSAAGMSSSRCS